MLFSVRQRDRLALGIARADVDAQLQLVIEPAAGAVDRRRSAWRHALSHGAAKLLPADAYAGRAAVVRNRHPLEVGRQRVVRTGQLADAAGMVDGRVEIRVVADAAGQGVFHRSLWHQALAQRVHARAGGRALQQGKQRMAQRAPGGWPHRHEIVERVLGAGPGCIGGQAAQRAGLAQRSKINHLVANGNATTNGFGGARCTRRASEYRKRQVLDRKVAAVEVGAGEPAAGGAVVGGVQGHGLVHREEGFEMGFQRAGQNPQQRLCSVTRTPSARHRRSPRRGSSRPRRRGFCGESS